MRQRVWWQMLTDPSTSLPTLAGVASLFFAWNNDLGAIAWYGGAACLAGGAGLLVLQRVLMRDEHTRRAIADLKAEDLAERERKLGNLHRRLKNNDDPRDEELLKRMRGLFRNFQQDHAWTSGLQPHTAADIAAQVEKLYSACILSLAHSHELLQRSNRLATPEARLAAQASREQVLAEVEQSVGQLEKTLGGVQTLRLQAGGDNNLARLRRELDASLDVARRVEDRLEAELGDVPTPGDSLTDRW